MEGHSSDDGDSLSNLELSRDRAIIIKQTLIDLGTDPDRIKINALGEEEPIFDNKSTNGDRFNRSVLIILYQEWNKLLMKQVKTCICLYDSKFYICILLTIN